MSVLGQNGVTSSRLGVMGYGEYRPRVPNPASGGSEANRRVEIFLVSSNEAIPTDTTGSASTGTAEPMTGASAPIDEP